MTYVIAKISDAREAQRVHTVDQHERAIAAYLRYQFTEKTEANQWAAREVYFADSKEQAETCANWLATNNPGTKWATAKLETLTHVAPGPLTRAQYTERGLLPINEG